MLESKATGAKDRKMKINKGKAADLQISLSRANSPVIRRGEDTVGHQPNERVIGHSASEPTASEGDPPTANCPLCVELGQEILDVIRVIKRDVRKLRRQLQDQADNAVEKEFYSTKEAAKILKRRPFTVRQWCNLGRIDAAKAEGGRGKFGEWLIPLPEIRPIKSEGLPPLPDEH
jgi:hypothetical protein